VFVGVVVCYGREQKTDCVRERNLKRGSLLQVCLVFLHVRVLLPIVIRKCACLLQMGEKREGVCLCVATCGRKEESGYECFLLCLLFARRSLLQMEKKKCTSHVCMLLAVGERKMKVGVCVLDV